MVPMASSTKLHGAVLDSFCCPKGEPQGYGESTARAALASSWTINNKKALHFSVQGFCLNGADGQTRTGTGCPTTPSRWRVYQFHHIGIKVLLIRHRNVRSRLSRLITGYRYINFLFFDCIYYTRRFNFLIRKVCE